jgi:hypothetical protein
MRAEPNDSILQQMAFKLCKKGWNEHWTININYPELCFSFRILTSKQNLSCYTKKKNEKWSKLVGLRCDVEGAKKDQDLVILVWTSSSMKSQTCFLQSI